MSDGDENVFFFSGHIFQIPFSSIKGDKPLAVQRDNVEALESLFSVSHTTYIH